MSTLWFERLTFMTELIQDFASCLTWRPNQAKLPAPAMLCWPPKATVVLQVSYDLAWRAQWDVANAINNYPRLLVVPFDLPVIKYTTVTYESLGSLSKWLSMAGAAKATGSKIVKKQVIEHVSCSHPAVACNPSMLVGRFWRTLWYVDLSCFFLCFIQSPEQF